MSCAFQLLPPCKQFDKINIIYIQYHNSKIIVWLNFHSQPYSFHIEYRKDNESTVVSCEKTKQSMTLENQNFVTVFCRDLKEILKFLRNQKSKSTEIKIDFEEKDDLGTERNLDWIENMIFESMEGGEAGEKIKIESLNFQFYNGIIPSLTPIFEILDAEKLQEIRIDMRNGGKKRNDGSQFIIPWWKRRSRINQFEEFLKLNFWQNAENCQFDISFDNLGCEVLKVFKETCFNNPHFSSILNYKTIDISGLDEVFGTKFRLEDDFNYKPQFVPIPDQADHRLKIILASMGYVTISRVPMNESQATNIDEKIKELAEFLSEMTLTRKKKEEEKSITTSNDDVKQNWLYIFANRIIMEHVLKHAQCFGIQLLRKVAYSIRNCIDHIKPDPRVKAIFLDYDDTDTIEWQIEIWNGLTFRGMYEQIEENIVRINSEKKISGKSREIFFNDLRINLEHQKQFLEELRIDYTFDDVEDTSMYSEFLGDLKRFLNSRQPLLEVKKLEMEVVIQSDLMEVLPYLDAKLIKTLELKNPNFEQPIPFEIDEVSKLEQWKNAEELVMNEHFITNSIQEIDISSFVKVDIKMNIITSMDVNWLKGEFLKTPAMEKVHITFKTIDGIIMHILGAPSSISKVDKAIHSVWFFRIPESQFALHLLDIALSSVTLTRVKLEAVPGNGFQEERVVEHVDNI